MSNLLLHLGQTELSDNFKVIGIDLLQLGHTTNFLMDIMPNKINTIPKNDLSLNAILYKPDSIRKIDAILIILSFCTLFIFYLIKLLCLI